METEQGALAQITHQYADIAEEQAQAGDPHGDSVTVSLEPSHANIRTPDVAAEEPSHICHECGKSFWTRRSLLGHQIHHRSASMKDMVESKKLNRLKKKTKKLTSIEAPGSDEVQSQPQAELQLVFAQSQPEAEEQREQTPALEREQHHDQAGSDSCHQASTAGPSQPAQPTLNGNQHDIKDQPEAAEPRSRVKKRKIKPRSNRAPDGSWVCDICHARFSDGQSLGGHKTGHHYQRRQAKMRAADMATVNAAALYAVQGGGNYAPSTKPTTNAITPDTALPTQAQVALPAGPTKHKLTATASFSHAGGQQSEKVVHILSPSAPLNIKAAARLSPIHEALPTTSEAPVNVPSTASLERTAPSHAFSESFAQAEAALQSPVAKRLRPTRVAKRFPEDSLAAASHASKKRLKRSKASVNTRQNSSKHSRLVRERKATNVNNSPSNGVQGDRSFAARRSVAHSASRSIAQTAASTAFVDSTYDEQDLLPGSAMAVIPEALTRTTVTPAGDDIDSMGTLSDSDCDTYTEYLKGSETAASVHVLTPPQATATVTPRRSPARLPGSLPAGWIRLLAQRNDGEGIYAVCYRTPCGCLLWSQQDMKNFLLTKAGDTDYWHVTPLQFSFNLNQPLGMPMPTQAASGQHSMVEWSRTGEPAGFDAMRLALPRLQHERQPEFLFHTPHYPRLGPQQQGAERSWHMRAIHEEAVEDQPMCSPTAAASFANDLDVFKERRQSFEKYLNSPPEVELATEVETSMATAVTDSDLDVLSALLQVRDAAAMIARHDRDNDVDDEAFERSAQALNEALHETARVAQALPS